MIDQRGTNNVVVLCGRCGVRGAARAYRVTTATVDGLAMLLLVLPRGWRNDVSPRGGADAGASPISARDELAMASQAAAVCGACVADQAREPEPREQLEQRGPRPEATEGSGS